MRKILSLMTIMPLLYGSILCAQVRQLIKKWETDSVLKVPESVLLDAENNFLYVSNIDGHLPWDKDGKGSIGKITTEGKIIQVDWVTGLNAPKGMALIGNNLYVADIDEVVVIDTKTEKIINHIQIQGALALNDITSDGRNNVYVSDSRLKKVFKIQNDQVEVFIENLKGPNGIFLDGSDFYVLDNGGLYYMWPGRTPRIVAEGMDEGTDGIQQIDRNEFLVSCWGGTIWYIDQKGVIQMLLDTRNQKINSADIWYDPATRTVYVPTFWKNTVAAYELK